MATMDEMVEKTAPSTFEKVRSQDASKDDLVEGIARSAMKNVEERARKEKVNKLIASIPNGRYGEHR